MSASKFESIGEDMMVEVFLKVGQNFKALIRLRCISKSWRRLVNSQCLHMRTCNDPLEFKGHLMKVELGYLFSETKHHPVLAYTAHRCQGNGDHFDKEEEGRRLLEKIEGDEGLVFLDACNGLLLHRLKINDDDDGDDSSSPPPPPPVYRVSNLETNSCVVVNGEPDTADSMYNKMDHAVLAYDPAESLLSFKIVAFFRRPAPVPYEHLLHKCMRKIVAFFRKPTPHYVHLFQRCMRIYSSKTGKWTPDLYFDHHLRHDLGCRWIQQSVYLNGAIYRLPRRHHLLRFEITEEENCDGQYCRAQVIRPPKGTLVYTYPIVGINKGQINLASMDKFKQGLNVWVLQEEGHGNNYSYQWILKHRIRKLKIPKVLMLKVSYGNFRPLGFHPYEDVIVLFTLSYRHFRFICYHLIGRNLISLSTDYHAVRDTLGQHYDFQPYFFPLFSCAVPLTNWVEG